MSTTSVGPILYIELELRAVSATEGSRRGVEYQIGVRTLAELPAFAERAGKLLAEDPSRTWTLHAEADVSWQECLRVLDVLRDLGVQPTFVRPAPEGR